MSFRCVPSRPLPSASYQEDAYWQDPNRAPGQLIDELVVCHPIQDDAQAQAVIREALRRGIPVRAQHCPEPGVEEQLAAFLAGKKVAA